MRIDELSECRPVTYQRLERQIAVPSHGKDRAGGQDHEDDRREPSQPERRGSARFVEHGGSLVGVHDPSRPVGRSRPEGYTPAKPDGSTFTAI